MGRVQYAVAEGVEWRMSHYSFGRCGRIGFSIIPKSFCGPRSTIKNPNALGIQCGKAAIIEANPGKGSALRNPKIMDAIVLPITNTTRYVNKTSSTKFQTANYF